MLDVPDTFQFFFYKYSTIYRKRSKSLIPPRMPSRRLLISDRLLDVYSSQRSFPPLFRSEAC
jgi:hypothetical protein